MIPTIYFNDEMVMKVSEISDIVSNDMLSTELCSQLLAFDEFPKNSFCLSWIFPMLFGKLFNERILFATCLVNIHDCFSFMAPLLSEGLGEASSLFRGSLPFGGVGGGSPLHPLRHFDTQKAHAVLDGLRHTGRQLHTHIADGSVLLVQHAVVMVELVVQLRQLVAVVGDATG